MLSICVLPSLEQEHIFVNYDFNSSFLSTSASTSLNSGFSKIVPDSLSTHTYGLICESGIGFDFDKNNTDPTIICAVVM